MAVSYVGGKGAGTAGQGGGSINFDPLSGGSGGLPIAGDLVVVTICVGTAGRNPALTIATPTGYTALTLNHTTATTYDVSVRTSYKFMTSTPDTAVTIPASGNNADGIAYSIQVFRGVDSASFPQVTPTYATRTGVDNLPDPASIQPTVAGSWIIVCGGGAAGAGGTFSAAYLTNFLTFNGPDTNDGNVGSGYYTGWTSGSYDPAQFTGGSVNVANSQGATTIVLAPILVSITASPGAFDLTGIAASPLADRMLTASPGAHTLTGFLLDLQVGHWISGEPGGYLFSGVAATVLANRLLSLDPGIYDLTGVQSTLVVGHLINAEPGGYTLTGFLADLVYVPFVGFFLNVDPGSFTLSGIAASTLTDRLLNADNGVFLITGTDASIVAQRILASDPNAYVVTGSDIGTLVARTILSDPGSYGITGVDASLRLSDVIMSAAPGTYVIVGSLTMAQLDLFQFPEGAGGVRRLMYFKVRR